MNKAVKFLLEYAVKHGDVVDHEQAKALLEEMATPLAVPASVAGAQTPTGKEGKDEKASSTAATVK